MRPKTGDTANILFIIVVCIVAVLPYLIMGISCFSTSASIKGNLIFSDISLSNFVSNWDSLMNEKYFLSSLWNSFFVSTLASLGGVLVASMAGYAYTIYSSKKINWLFLASFYSMLIPTAAILVPIFLIFKYTNLLDTYLALILTSMSIPFLIYLFKQNTRLFPTELISAAKIDGLSELSIFFKVYIPYLKPVYIAAIMISFFNAWNSILIPVVILQSQYKFTNAIFLNSLGSIWSADYAVMMLALLISTLPPLVLFLIFQRHIIKTMGGIN